MAREKKPVHKMQTNGKRNIIQQLIWEYGYSGPTGPQVYLRITGIQKALERYIRY
ncbi:hypothetical protein acsn021_06490 [Anaerocolumna cellulosilytica]|uniref:Uncharacterized protein n=1 Tax=Anaerocolumna cellulosilytica TaxID=433286 RepID=A0A6S6R194_9FIRM|nr:hypothetical protein [Anaerocolumna cellulosilytica]BCJ93080.1 hypothetical protein acsn021_06490 [Anaerocolumna cellulosilytica]